ncbi:MAG: hypothetical protein PHX50_17540 [Massilibacteroides sp.]|nr:hypothetical protein [Massilibacteroides sp.]
METKAYEWSENKEEVSEGDEPRATHQNIRGKQYYINQIHQ